MWKSQQQIAGTVFLYFVSLYLQWLLQIVSDFYYETSFQNINCYYNASFFIETKYKKGHEQKVHKQIKGKPRPETQRNSLLQQPIQDCNQDSTCPAR